MKINCYRRTLSSFSSVLSCEGPSGKGRGAPCKLWPALHLVPRAGSAQLLKALAAVQQAAGYLLAGTKSWHLEKAQSISDLTSSGGLLGLDFHNNQRILDDKVTILGFSQDM